MSEGSFGDGLAPVEVAVQKTAQTELPRSQGTADEVDRFKRAMNFIPLWQDRRENGFTAQLPEIIADVPEEEQSFFSSFPENATGSTYIDPQIDREKYERMRAGLPTVFSAIEEDLTRLGLDPELDYCRIAREETKVGQESFGLDFGWHIDRAPLYLVSNTLPTEYYGGKVGPLKGHKEGRVTVLDSEDSSTVVAPPYSVVRMDPYTVHRAQVANQSTMRTLMFLSPKSP